MAEKRKETSRQEGIDRPGAAERNGTGTRTAGEGQSRRRLGILSFASPGHYYPLTALGRRLQSRGHQVVYFQVADVERPIRAAGLQFRQIGKADFPRGAIPKLDEEAGKLTGRQALRHAMGRLTRNATMLFRD